MKKIKLRDYAIGCVVGFLIAFLVLFFLFKVLPEETGTSNKQTMKKVCAINVVIKLWF